MSDEEKLARKENKVGYSHWLMSVSGNAFDHVTGARTSEQQSGDLALAFEKLKEVYQPTNKTELVLMKAEFNKCKLASFKSDPEDWFSELNHKAKLLEIMGQPIDDDGMKSHILMNLAPKEYESLASNTWLTQLLWRG